MYKVRAKLEVTFEVHVTAKNEEILDNLIIQMKDDNYISEACNSSRGYKYEKGDITNIHKATVITRK